MFVGVSTPMPWKSCGWSSPSMAGWLKFGPVEEEAVERGGKGVSKRTLQRAKESLGVQSVKGFGKGASWYWHLPSVSAAEARDRLQQIPIPAKSLASLPMPFGRKSRRRTVRR